MRLYILRHGETVWNVQRRLQGCADIPLNENGEYLARITGRALCNVPFDYCVSSPLIRAQRTAELVLEGRDVPIYTDRRIQEIGFGEWEGLSCDQNNFEIPDPNFPEFFRNPENYTPHPSGETLESICGRTREFMNELAANKENENKTILISSHGCCVRALLRCVEEKTENFWRNCVPPNCSINVVDEKNGVFHLIEEDKIFYDRSKVLSYVG